MGACPYCWEHHAPENFMAPIIPDNPNAIIVLGSPSHEDIKNGGVFKTPAGKELRHILIKTGCTPIILYARQCYKRAEPTTQQIHTNREAFLLPLLDKYPSIPIIAMGRHATVYLQGGQIPKKEPPINRTRILYDRLAVFTYDTNAYLEKQEENGATKAAHVLDNIQITIKAALLPAPTINYTTNVLPTDVKRIVIDIESSSSEYPWYGGQMAMLGIKPLGGVPYAIRFSELTLEFKEFLNANVELVVGHNLMYDLVDLAYHGITFPKAKLHDTMVYHKNLFPFEWYNGLKPLAKKYCGFHHWDAWFSTKFKNKEKMSEIDEKKLFVYNAWDLTATEALFNLQQRKYTPFRLEMDYMPYIVGMTLNGMHVDREALQKLTNETRQQFEEAKGAIRAEFSLGKDFNFDSPSQIKNFLQRYVLDLPNTQKDTLLKMQGEHPFIGKLLEIKKLSKLLGTGLEGLAERVTEDAFVHSSFQVHGAETGRSSSSSPNLQNTDPKVRSCFTPRFLNGKMVYTDLASLEYRLIAHITADAKLLRIFQNGEDIHANAYRDVYGVMPPDKTERKRGKFFNFGGVYGCGLNKFLDLAKLDRKIGEPIFAKMSKLYPGVVRWKKDMVYRLRQTGIVRNLFGRIRTFEMPITNNDEREAFNWIIQSSGHDILKIYLMESVDRVYAATSKSLLISEVHDSMTFDCPDDEYKAVNEIICELGGNLNPLIYEVYGVTMRVPMFAEIEILEAWA